MNETTMTTTPAGPPPRDDEPARDDSRPVTRGWPRWAPYAAALWSLTYGGFALVWTLTGSGFPLGTNDSEKWSLLADLPADVGAPLFAAIALAGAGAAALMARVPATGRRSLAQLAPWARPALIGFGSVFALALLAVLPDTRVLALIGYLPMVIVRAPFDAAVRDRLAEVLEPVYLHHAAAILGGLLWVLATLAFARRTAGACGRCGRSDRVATWTAPQRAARWGRPVTYLAAAIPAVYALTRFAWAAGIPLGISEEFLAEGDAAGMWTAALWLGGFAVVGAVLTLGLVQRWGEVFPRWMLGLRGRRVPVGLAVVPASIVAALVFNGGVGMYAASFRKGTFELAADSWGTVGPTLLWPLWGVALAAAAVAYYLRRRRACQDCGRG